MEDRSRRMSNDARQGSADRPAFGERAEDFGAGGQTVINSEPRAPQRDPDRDPKLDETGTKASQANRRTP
jgi:hypothetical protein